MAFPWFSWRCIGHISDFSSRASDVLFLRRNIGRRLVKIQALLSLWYLSRPGFPNGGLASGNCFEFQALEESLDALVRLQYAAAVWKRCRIFLRFYVVVRPTRSVGNCLKDNRNHGYWSSWGETQATWEPFLLWRQRERFLQRRDFVRCFATIVRWMLQLHSSKGQECQWIYWAW